MKYETLIKNNTYFYIYPPRPENAISHTELFKYDNTNFIAQPKYNGTCCIVFIPPAGTGIPIVMNRHKRPIQNTFNIEFASLNTTDEWMVLVGELMNKSKKDEKGNLFNGKFILFDILVYNGDYLLKTTLEERLLILEELFPSVRTAVTKKGGVQNWQHICPTRVDNVYKAPSYTVRFEEVYHSIVETDMYEGLVLKKKNVPLGFGTQEVNNDKWQLKCRKPTKNYNF